MPLHQCERQAAMPEVYHASQSDRRSGRARDIDRGGKQLRRETTVTPWKLKRVMQCVKCPWRTEVDPHDIPNGYTKERHHALSRTIAEPGSIRETAAMACHESGHQPAHCVGWLVNQLGPGNNIALRIRMISCENAKFIKLRGKQHERFEDTLPE